MMTVLYRAPYCIFFPFLNTNKNWKQHRMSLANNIIAFFFNAKKLKTMTITMTRVLNYEPQFISSHSQIQRRTGNIV